MDRAAVREDDSAMPADRARRSNTEWIAALQGAGDPAAVRELEVYLRRSLGRAVRGRFDDGDVGELVQESLARICESLGSFRGDSAFTTWAVAVAHRVAFTELRRRQARSNAPRGLAEVEAEVEQLVATRTLAPGDALARSDLLEALQRAIATRLTDRQRVAILAELHGLPTVEIAARLGTNQNALYKLHHDARKKLRQALLSDGFTAASIHALAAEVPT